MEMVRDLVPLQICVLFKTAVKVDQVLIVQASGFVQLFLVTCKQ
jgi:hypothetical protein